jgi:hypothetical protein
MRWKKGNDPPLATASGPDRFSFEHFVATVHFFLDARSQDNRLGGHPVRSRLRRQVRESVAHHELFRKPDCL